MFTGIVEELGTVAAIEHGADSAVLRIDGPLVVSDATHGASIAVNGVCLTVDRARRDGFTVDVMAETLDRSSLGRARPGRPRQPRARDARRRPVRRPRRPGPRRRHRAPSRRARPGTVGRRSTSRSRPAWRHTSSRRARSPSTACRSPCARRRRPFGVSLIPTTLDLTTLGHKGVGDVVNLEVDVIAKYVERLLTHRQTGGRVMTDRSRPSRRPSRRSRRAGPSWSSTTRTARTRATSSSRRRDRHRGLDGVDDPPLAPATSARRCPTRCADRLELPLMVAENRDPLRTAYTVSVDAATGVTTGISAADRLRTVQVLADVDATPADLIRPGHILPLRARPGGVLTRPGHTEAAVDLTRLAGLRARRRHRRARPRRRHDDAASTPSSRSAASSACRSSPSSSSSTTASASTGSSASRRPASRRSTARSPRTATATP